MITAIYAPRRLPGGAPAVVLIGADGDTLPLPVNEARSLVAEITKALAAADKAGELANSRYIGAQNVMSQG